MATELGVAYVSVVPDMSKFGVQLQGAMAKSGTAGGGLFNRGFLGAIKSTAIGTALGKALGSAMGAVTSSIGSAVARVDELNNFPKIMANLGYSTGDAQEAIARMGAAIDGLPTSLNSMTSAATKIAPLTGSLSDATSITIALNNALLAGGKSTELQANALEQFSQMLAVGKVDMAAWRSMVSAMPGQLDQLAVALLGAGAKNMDLYEAMKSGAVTFDEFNAALVDLNANGVDGFASFEQQARTSTEGIGTALENVQNRVNRAVATVIDHIGQANIAGAINGWSSSFAGMADNVVWAMDKVWSWIGVDRITEAMGGVPGAFGGVLDTAKLNFETFARHAGQAFTDVAVAAGPFLEAVGGGLSTAIDAATPVVNRIVDAIGTGLSGALEAATPLIQPMADAFSVVCDVLGTVMDVVGPFVPAIAGAVVAFMGFQKLQGAIATLRMLPLAFQAITTAIGGPIPIIVAVVAAIATFVATNDEARATIARVWDAIVRTFRTVLGAIGGAVSGAWNGIRNATTTAFNAVRNFVTGAWNGIRTAVATVVGGVRAAVTGAWNAVSNVTSTVFGAVAATASNVWNGIRNAVGGVVGGISSNVSAVFNGLRNTVSTIWNNIQRAITGPIDTARNLVRTAINTISGIITGANLTLPRIKLPHFRIDGGKVPWGIGGIGTPPKVSIDWYARGGIVDGATLIGVGEKGSELVVPAENRRYMRPFAEAVAQGMPMGEVVSEIRRFRREIGPIIGRYAPEMAARDRDRMIRRAVA